ncbi:MAG: class I SAM-dependent methyltransferase [Candidatus Omnitrophota bacterium]|nr:class I SAM-dependent methyltransferase [Candidatus Omnitrophota bacterium]
MGIDYSAVTEVPGNKVSREQLERMYHRYHFASQYCGDKDVLEIACGAGQGLGYLSEFAKRLVGGDVDKNILKLAQQHYHGRDNIELKLLDAHKLLFGDESFDVVICYEAIYYFTRPEEFIKEAYRVLKKKGLFVICTVNKGWLDFNPSPHSKKYFSAIELYQLLNRDFTGIDIYGAFGVSYNSAKTKFISLLKRAAVSLNLMPKTMKGKEFFKRIFFGRLQVLPSELKKGMAEYLSPTLLTKEFPAKDYKVIYAVAKK